MMRFTLTTQTVCLLPDDHDVKVAGINEETYLRREDVLRLVSRFQVASPERKEQILQALRDLRANS